MTRTEFRSRAAALRVLAAIHGPPPLPFVSVDTLLDPDPGRAAAGSADPAPGRTSYRNIAPAEGR